MVKKICVISSNCQGAYIKELLMAASRFNDLYEVHYFVNYNHEVAPDELLAKCSLLIYQPLSEKWGDLSADRLIRMISPECKRIAINYLTFPLYWPFIQDDPRNKPEKDYPFGPFPYGDSLLYKLATEETSTEAAIDRYLEGQGHAWNYDPEAVEARYIASQRDIEKRRDQKLLDFILSNYQEVKLFESHNHPSRALCIYQVNDLLEQLGIDPLDDQDAPSLDFLKVYEQPIHPVIAGRLQLKFECSETTPYNIWGKPVNFLEFTKAYIEWDLSLIGKIQVPPFKIETDTPEAPAHAISQVDQPIVTTQIFFVHIPKTAGSSLYQMLFKTFGLADDYRHFVSTLALLEHPGRRQLPLVVGHIHYDVAQTLLPSPVIFTFLRDPVERTISAFEFFKSQPEDRFGALAQGSITEFFSHPLVRLNEDNIHTRLLGLEIPFPRLWQRFEKGEIDSDGYFSSIENCMNQPASAQVLENAKRRLKSLDFFGFTETYATDVAELFALLGKPCPEVAKTNVTPSQFRAQDRYTQEEVDLIIASNWFDIQLYEFAKDLRKSSNSAKETDA